MAVGWAIASGVTRIVGGRRRKKSAKKAAREQARIDAENRARYRAEVDESIRRTEEQHRFTEGTARTQVGASGFAAGSSLDAYVETMQSQHASDIDWMRTSGASQEAIMEREATARLRNANASADAAFIGDIGSAIGSFGQAASMKQQGLSWWGF